MISLRIKHSLSFYEFPHLCCSCTHDAWPLQWHTIWNENSGPHMHITVPFDPKSLKLSWITGTSFGLTPFWSDSIDYVACAIPVRDVTNINIVNPHWDNTTWVYGHQGISSQEVSSLCLITYNDSLPIHITKCKVIILSHQMQGDYSEVYFKTASRWCP